MFVPTHPTQQATPYHFLEVEGNEEEAEVHVGFSFSKWRKRLYCLLCFILIGWKASPLYGEGPFYLMSAMFAEADMA